MEILRKVINLSNKDYYKTHFNLINALLGNKLASKEIDVLAEFLSLDPKITAGDMFNPLARKVVKQSLGLSSASLSNYIRFLSAKNILIKDDYTGRYEIASFILPEVKEQKYQFYLKNRDEVG